MRPYKHVFLYLFSINEGAAALQLGSAQSSNGMDVIYRTMRNDTHVNLKVTGPSPQNYVDLIVAVDSASARINQRIMTRKWFANLSSPFMSAALFFFCDQQLQDALPSEQVLQPLDNRGGGVTSMWAKRWIFDVSWAAMHYQFKWLIRADDDGILCNGAFVQLLNILPPDGPVVALSALSEDQNGADIRIREGMATLSEESFEENWMLLSESFVGGLLRKVKSSFAYTPTPNENVAQWFDRLFAQHSDELNATVANIGVHSFVDGGDDKGRRPAKMVFPGGRSVWDTNLEGSLFHNVHRFDEFQRICETSSIIWFHHVEADSLV